MGNEVQGDERLEVDKGSLELLFFAFLTGYVHSIEEEYFRNSVWLSTARNYPANQST